MKVVARRQDFDPSPNTFGRDTVQLGACKESLDSFWPDTVFLQAAALAHRPTISAPRSLNEDSSDEDSQIGKVDFCRPFVSLPYRINTTAFYRVWSSTSMPEESLTSPSWNLVFAGTSGSLLLGLNFAVFEGFSRATHPPSIAIVSSLLSLIASAGCICALHKGTPGSSVDLPPWMTFALACFCSMLAPLPLAPLSKAALASISAPVLLALPGVVGATVLFEIGHRSWASIDAEQLAQLTHAEHNMQPDLQRGNDRLLARASQHWWRHFCPFQNGNRGIGSVFLASHLLLAFCSVQIDLVLTQWRNNFFNVLQARDALGFQQQLWNFLPIVAVSMLGSTYGGYLTTIWDLRWREELVKDFLGLWLDTKSYYYVRFVGQNSGQEGQTAIDNFDQRIVEDTSLFAGSSRSLLCGFAESLIRLAVFGPALYRLAPTPMVWQLSLGLSFLSSVLTHFIGKPLVTRNADLQRAEADLRSSMMRLRLFAEDVFLQQNEEVEGYRATRYFEAVKAATWLAARGTLQLTSYTSVYGLVGSLLPLLILAPSYFQGHMSLGLLFQLEAVIGGVRQSLDFFVGAYGDICLWQASASRLLALEECSLHYRSQMQSVGRGDLHMQSEDQEETSSVKEPEEEQEIQYITNTAST